MTIIDSPYEESYPPWVVWNIASTATLASITPSTAVVSPTALAQLDCTGTGFTAGARIIRDGVPLPTTVVTAGTVLRTTGFIPTPVGAANIRVQNDGQLPTAPRVFTVTAAELLSAAAEQEPAGEASEPSSEPPPPGRRRSNGRART